MSDDPEKEDATKNREELLKDELKKLKDRYSRRSAMTRLYMVVGLLMFVATPIVYFIFNNKLTMFFLLYGVLFLVAPLAKPLSILEIQIRDIENEIDLLGMTVSPAEQRAEKLFKSHQLELKKYYDQTLRHSTWIFVVGIFCIALGFGVVIWAIYAVQTMQPQSELSDKIVIGTLGSVAGILANFIAVIYLKMFSEIVKSLTEFHSRLVTTHHLHFANFLTAKIEDALLKQKTLADMAETLSKK